MPTPVVSGMPVEQPVGVRYISASSGAHASYFVRSDGAVDRSKGYGKVHQRLPPPEKTVYTAASAGLHASYLLRADGAVDMLTGGKEFKIDTILPEAHPKVTYTAVSNSMGPCYLLRSDGVVDLLRMGKVESQLPDGPYQQICGGTDASYHLTAAGAVNKVWQFGKVSHSFPSPDGTKYVRVASQCVSAKNDKGGGGASSVYFLRADGKVDRATVIRSALDRTIEPPEGITYSDIACQDTSSYLLRSDGAVDRTTGGGKIDNTMNPPPGQTYTSISAGQMSSYFVRSDGKIDRTTGWGKVKDTISPEAEPEDGSACSLM